MLFLENREFFVFFLSCRRGMLELDLILLNFLDVRYYDLDLQFKNDFLSMLSESDDNLYNWLVKKKFSYTCSFDYVVSEIIKTTNMFDFY